MDDKTRIDEDQPIPAAQQVIEWEDMTDEQKRIVEAGQTIAGTFPQGLSKADLSAWIMQRFVHD